MRPARVLGCRVEALRAHRRAGGGEQRPVRVEGSSVYRCSVVLRNRADIEVVLPALDLSLTDTQGRLIARRVLQRHRPGRVVSPRSAPARELALQATLQAALPSAEPVAGYTIELFYP